MDNRSGKCPYCENDTDDFIELNQTAEYSGIEMSLDKTGCLRVRVFPFGLSENFESQDIVEIKYCPCCGKPFRK